MLHRIGDLQSLMRIRAFDEAFSSVLEIWYKGRLLVFLYSKYGVNACTHFCQDQIVAFDFVAASQSPFVGSLHTGSENSLKDLYDVTVTIVYFVLNSHSFSSSSLLITRKHTSAPETLSSILPCFLYAVVILLSYGDQV